MPSSSRAAEAGAPRRGGSRPLPDEHPRGGRAAVSVAPRHLRPLAAEPLANRCCGVTSVQPPFVCRGDPETRWQEERAEPPPEGGRLVQEAASAPEAVQNETGLSSRGGTVAAELVIRE